ncbi:hypothetical protein SAY87_004724 [Trapa incisa]|uniref:Homeobox-leucine zipper protein n=1 Tax=Trapa incisa TaxID=236973 RepID=A0AAN7JPA7_9MYRT|nr:hypothetical protein SAY87_004724 [Trapa incisa]
MEWPPNLVNPRPYSSPDMDSFLFNYTFHHLPPPGTMDQTKHSSMVTTPSSLQQVALEGSEKKFGCLGNQSEMRRKKMTSNQLESLERSFQEEIKLDPDRKKRLSRELGLHPRQIAVWFQNRRARWKAKQLECLYDSLKQEFDVIAMEKLKLQEEVLRLKAMIRDQTAGMATQKQVGGYTEVSCVETVESTSTDIHRPRQTDKAAAAAVAGVSHQNTAGDQSDYLLSIPKEYNSTVSASYWGLLPSYNPQQALL